MQECAWNYIEARLEKLLKAGVVSPVSSVIVGDIQKLGGADSIASDAEMTDFLDSLLEEATKGRSFGFEKLAGPSGPQHKWRYSSAYQKAVRRNHPSIKAVAAELNQCDPAYLWRRAPTIALEDVGIGDPWVCALVLHACRFSKVRVRYGMDPLAGFLGELMGSAVKDRLSCDSFCLPIFHPELASQRAIVDDLPVAEKAELYRSDHTPIGCRVAAGISLAGPRYGGDFLGGMGGSPEQFAEAAQGLVPYPIQWISRQYARMARDGMFVALPLVWRQLTSEGRTEVIQHELATRTLIQGVLPATFDGHTQEGRRAISYFIRTCGPVQKLLDGFPNKSKLVALAIFTIDSSLLDRQITSPWAAEMYRENLRGEVLAAGMPTDAFANLTDLVLANLDVLDRARIRVTQ